MPGIQKGSDFSSNSKLVTKWFGSPTSLEPDEHVKKRYTRACNTMHRPLLEMSRGLLLPAVALTVASCLLRGLLHRPVALTAAGVRWVDCILIIVGGPMHRLHFSHCQGSDASTPF